MYFRDDKHRQQCPGHSRRNWRQELASLNKSSAYISRWDKRGVVPCKTFPDFKITRRWLRSFFHEIQMALLQLVQYAFSESSAVVFFSDGFMNSVGLSRYFAQKTIFVANVNLNKPLRNCKKDSARTWSQLDFQFAAYSFGIFSECRNRRNMFSLLVFATNPQINQYDVLYYK